MDLAGVDRLLDKVVVISIGLDSLGAFGDAVKRRYIPLYVDQKDDLIDIYLTFPIDFANTPRNLMLLSKYKAVRNDYNYSVKYNIQIDDMWSALWELRTLPYVVTDSIYLESSRVYFSLRFNEKISNQVSELLNILTENENGRIEIIDDSPGMMQILERLNARFKLGVVQITTQKENGDVKDEYFTAETCGTEIEDDGIRAIRHVMDSNTVEQIFIKNKFIKEWRKRMNNIPVVRFRQLIRYNEDSIKLLQILPMDSVNQCYRTFYDQTKKNPNIKSTLNYSAIFRKDIIRKF